MLLFAFIDTNSDNKMDDQEVQVGSWFTITKGIANNHSIQLGKSIINVTVSGNPAILTHPILVHNAMRNGSSSMVVAPYANGTITTYGNLTGKHGASGNLQAFDDLNLNNWYDYGEPPISTETVHWEYAPTVNVSIILVDTAPQILPESEHVEVSTNLSSNYPSDLLHYRFVKDPNNNRCIFLIPCGAGTGGAPITCYQCETDPPRSNWHSGDHLWHLFDSIYAGQSAMRLRVMSNYQYQYVEWKQNIIDVISYLENTAGFTVYGKENLPANW